LHPDAIFNMVLNNTCDWWGAYKG